MNRGLLHLTRFRLRWRESKPPSPPQGGGEGFSGGEDYGEFRHPDADESGYVAFPKLNPAEEMVDLMSATRGYQANVSAMSAVKDMILRSIDLMK